MMVSGLPCHAGAPVAAVPPVHRVPLAAFSWKGLHAEAAVSDRIPVSAELRLQNLSVQRWLLNAERRASQWPAAGMVTSRLRMTRSNIRIGVGYYWCRRRLPCQSIQKHMHLTWLHAC
jgi:hypothetical protein